MDKESVEKLEIYSLYVKSSLAVSETRMAVTVLLVLLNTFIFMEISLVPKAADSYVVRWLITIINFWWSSHIISSEKLNCAKFKVIYEMEEELPYAPFKEEERCYKNDRRRDISSVEKYLPFLFIMLHVLIILFKP